MTADEQTLKNDWLWILNKVRDYSPATIDSLKDIGFEVTELKAKNGIGERAAEFETGGTTLKPKYVLRVQPDYFSFKKEIQISVLLHELGHGIVISDYVTVGDLDGLKKYEKDNNGHNDEWWDIVTDLESYFPNVKVTEILDLNNDDIYETTLSEGKVSRRGFVWMF